MGAENAHCGRQRDPDGVVNPTPANNRRQFAALPSKGPVAQWIEPRVDRLPRPVIARYLQTAGRLPLAYGQHCKALELLGGDRRTEEEYVAALDAAPETAEVGFRRWAS
jgi:hypothetical protein